MHQSGEVNIGLQITKNNNGRIERTSIVTNSVEEIRRMIDNLEAECGEAAATEPESGIVVAAEDLMPYGEGYISMDEGTFWNRKPDLSKVHGYKPPEEQESKGTLVRKALQMMAQGDDAASVAKALGKTTQMTHDLFQLLNKLTRLDITRMQMKDSIENKTVEKKLNEDWGQTNTSMAFQMMDGEIESEHEGKRNPGTIYSAAESAASLYADHMGFSTEEAIDWLSALYTEKHMDMGMDDGFDLGAPTPDDVFSDMPGMPGTNMMDDPMGMEPGMMGMEDPLGDMTSNDMAMAAASAPEPDLGMGGMTEGKYSPDTYDELPWNKEDEDLKQKELYDPDRNADKYMKRPRKPTRKYSSKDIYVDEDSDFDHRDEDNEAKDPNDYDRERDLMDFARTGHSKRPLKRGGLGDNRMAEPDEVFESQMARDWDRFKDSKKKLGEMSRSPSGRQVPSRNPRPDRGKHSFIVFNKKAYWQKVARALGMRLTDFDATLENSRDIEFNNGEISLFHSWRRDGTASKPVTTLSYTIYGDEWPEEGHQTSEGLGRFAIWEDPKKYAEDIMNIVHGQHPRN